MKDLMDVSRDHREMVEVIRNGDLEKAEARHGAHFVRIKGLLTRTADNDH
jgi:DNA-binding GntR family transcriptional regulator